MTKGEMVIAVLTAIGIVLGLLKVWIQSQTDLAKIQIQITAVNQRCDKSDQDFKEHKTEDNKKYELMRKENREDHGKIFDKIDELIKSRP